MSIDCNHKRCANYYECQEENFDRTSEFFFFKALDEHYKKLLPLLEQEYVEVNEFA